MAATATEEKKPAAAGLKELVKALIRGPLEVNDLFKSVPEDVVAEALYRGEVEIGKTKYVISGNPELRDLTHNGIIQAKSAVIIEGGIDWPMPVARLLQMEPLSKIVAEGLPTAQTYQKYQLEVRIDKNKDVWEWLEKPTDAKERETRYARRNIDRDEAESLFAYYIQLTEQGRKASRTA